MSYGLNFDNELKVERLKAELFLVANKLNSNGVRANSSFFDVYSVSYELAVACVFGRELEISSSQILEIIIERNCPYKAIYFLLAVVRKRLIDTNRASA